MMFAAFFFNNVVWHFAVSIQTKKLRLALGSGIKVSQIRRVRLDESQLMFDTQQPSL
jgi:hypothetical protein